MKVLYFLLFVLAWFVVFQFGFRRSVVDSIVLASSSVTIVFFIASLGGF